MVAQINNSIVNPVAVETKEIEFVKIISQSNVKRNNFVQINDIKATSHKLSIQDKNSFYIGAKGAVESGIDDLKNTTKNITRFAGDFVNEPGYAGEIFSNIGVGIKEAGSSAANYAFDMAVNDPLKFSKDIQVFTLKTAFDTANSVNEEYENYQIASENNSARAYLGAVTVGAAILTSSTIVENFSIIKPAKLFETAIDMKKMNANTDGTNNKGEPENFEISKDNLNMKSKLIRSDFAKRKEGLISNIDQLQQNLSSEILNFPNNIGSDLNKFFANFKLKIDPKNKDGFYEADTQSQKGLQEIEQSLKNHIILLKKNFKTQSSSISQLQELLNNLNEMQNKLGADIKLLLELQKQLRNAKL